MTSCHSQAGQQVLFYESRLHPSIFLAFLLSSVHPSLSFPSYPRRHTWVQMLGGGRKGGGAGGGVLILASFHPSVWMCVQLLSRLSDEDLKFVEDGCVISSNHGLRPPLRERVWRREEG